VIWVCVCISCGASTLFIGHHVSKNLFHYIFIQKDSFLDGVEGNHRELTRKMEMVLVSQYLMSLLFLLKCITSVLTSSVIHTAFDRL